LAQHQRGHQVAFALDAGGQHLGVLGRPFDPQIVRVVFVVAVAVILAIGEVALDGEADQILQREPVMRGHKVD
jgi:hypothetical protein